MFQIGCRLWNLSIVSVLILTFSNILLTVRLLHSSDCSRHILPEPQPQPQPAASHVGDVHGAGAAGAAGAGPAAAATVVTLTPVMAAAGAAAVAAAVAAGGASSSWSHNASVGGGGGGGGGSGSGGSWFETDLRLGRWDARHLYKMFDFVVVGERFSELSEQYSVSLATQSSLERLQSLVQVAHHWAGPISTAVFVAGDDEYRLLQYYVNYLRRCFVAVRDRVSFHLAYPKERPPSTSSRSSSRWSSSSSSSSLQQRRVDADHDAASKWSHQLDCLRPEAVLSELVRLRKADTVKWRLKSAYPQNHMRNLARRNCQTTFVFLTDVDIIPSARLAEALDVFLKSAKCRGLCAYVIPTYELDERVRFPRNKTDLIRLAKKGLARPFHQKVFIYNQFATNFSRWQEQPPEDSPAVHVSHNVTNFEFLYEPFYVAPDTAPAHDERFMGYGFTRNTQVYEMFVAGYQFQVLSPVFTCHWGLQTKKGRPSWRERQNSLNGRQFELFKREVFARYHKDTLKKITPRRQ